MSLRTCKSDWFGPLSYQMCGICGATNDPDGSQTKVMAAAMRHRGPDDEHVHIDSKTGVALGCRRLAVIDVDGGRQPLANEDGSIWATLNGEIYNHPALREGLLADGHVLATRSDTEVLVHLYEEYGDALVHALEGMFAFAVWDARRGRLVVARDRFGEKPLFYAHRGGELAFASELSALSRALPGADELDAAAVDAYFVHGYVPGPRTIIAGISQLPPGHMLTWDAASRQTQVTKYWEPLASPYDGPIESESELVGELDRLLEESVRGRMLSDVPLGVLLSGGVDSSLVASLVAERTSGPVPAFTVGYDIGDVSEISAARRTAKSIGAEHHTLTLTQSEVAGRLASVMAKIDQPLADQALMPLHAVSELAREHVTVVLGGEGADELFGGYPRYRWLSRATRIEDVVPAGLAREGARILRGMERGERTRHLTDLLEPRRVPSCAMSTGSPIVVSGPGCPSTESAARRPHPHSPGRS